MVFSAIKLEVVSGCLEDGWEDKRKGIKLVGDFVVKRKGIKFAGDFVVKRKGIKNVLVVKLEERVDELTGLVVEFE